MLTHLGTVLEQGPVPYARIINRSGKTVGAESTYVVEALNSITSDEEPIQFVDRENGWPIVAVSYQALLKDSTYCDRRRELFKFYHWIKTSTTAQERLISLGGSTLGNFLENSANAFLSNTTCNGIDVLQYKVIPQHVSKAFDALLVIAFVLWIISILLAALWHYVNKSRCAKEVILYQVIQLLGILVTYLSVAAWYAIPNADSTCACRQWLTCIGFTLVFAAMFERTFRIHRVYGRVFKQNKLTGNITSILEVGGGVAVILVTQIILLGKKIYLEVE